MGQARYAARGSGDKIYAVSGVCKGIYGRGKVMTASTRASSIEEAVGWGYAKMQLLFPPSENYYDYLVYVAEVPPAFINKVYPLVGWESGK